MLRKKGSDMTREERQLREAIIAKCRWMNASGLNQGTSGNISTRYEDRMLITPSATPYDAMKPEMIASMPLEGAYGEWDGPLQPSTEWRFHLDIMRARPDVGGIVHTHSTYATAWAQAGRDIPIYGTTHADHNTVDIPCAPPMNDEMILGDYEYQTGFQIMNAFRDRGLSYEEVEMVLVGNHAPFSWGKTPEKAVYNSAVLESVAQMAYLTEQIKTDALRLKDSLIKKHYERKHGPNSYYGQ